MKVKAFEKFVANKAKRPIDDEAYSFIGLAGEVGECMEWYKKTILRQDNKFTEADLALELGDVLHYLTRITLQHGWTLKDIMQGNVSKLENRYGLK